MGNLLTMAMNHLLNGMILQVEVVGRWSKFLKFRSIFCKCRSQEDVLLGCPAGFVRIKGDRISGL